MKRSFIRFFNVLAFLFVCSESNSQDFTFSQFQVNSQVFNPAFIGHAETDVRVMTSYRNQWFATGLPYQTFLISGEWKINPLPKLLKQSAVSLALVDDQIGNGQWRNTWLSSGFSATKELDAVHRHKLSLGISGAMLIRQFNAQNLVFENQFESGTFEFNPSIASGEGFENKRQTFFQINSGFQYDFEVSNRFKFGIGSSALWLYRPSEALSTVSAEQYSKMNSRITGLFAARWQVGTDLAFEPQCFFSEQGKAREFNFGGWLVFSSHLNNGGLWETGFGLFSRLGDALIPALRLGNKQFYGQLSYDATASDAKKVDKQKKFVGIGGMGSLEFSLVYGFDLKAKPFRTFPAPCQTF